MNFNLRKNQILLKKLPFEHIAAYQEWYDAISIRNIRPQLPQYIRDPVKSALEGAWATDPLKRPSAKELVAAFSELRNMSSKYISTGAGSDIMLNHNF